MVDISIRNYQSANNLDFTVDGFTIIIGRNNIGKSAIVRAIDAALTNQAGNDFISLGEKSSEVRMKFKEKDIDLLWEKSDTASYTINKKNYTKLNRAIPQVLIDNGFDKLEIGDKTISPLIVQQFKSLFLVNESGSTVTEVLASLYNINTLSTADDLCQKELKSSKSLLKTREADLINLQNRIEKYKDLESLKKEILDLSSLEKDSLLLQQKIQKLSEYEKELQSLHESIENLEKVKKIKIPNITTEEKEIADINWLKEKESAFEELSESVNVLKSATDIKIPDTHELESTLNKLLKLREFDDTFKSLSSDTKKQKALIDSFNIETLSKNMSDVEKLIKEFLSLETAEKEFNEAAISAKDARTDLNSIAKNLEDLEKQRAEVKICPLCDRSL